MELDLACSNGNRQNKKTTYQKQYFSMEIIAMLFGSKEECQC